MDPRIIFIGRTQLLRDCCLLTADFFPNHPIEIIDVSADKMNYLERTIPAGQHYRKMEKKETMDYLSTVDQPALVFSIMNPFIFPSSVVRNQNLTIINLHHALLPNHPGRNAEAWAIFEQDSEAGITWHLVDEGIDTGKIILQKSVALTPQITSCQLYKKLNELAAGSLKEVLSALKSGNLHTIPQEHASDTVVRKAKDRPNNGILNLDWDGNQISAFLRSMDYGILHTLGYPSISYNHVWYRCKKYKIQPDETGREYINLDGKALQITKDSLQIQIKLEEIQEDFPQDPHQ